MRQSLNPSLLTPNSSLLVLLPVLQTVGSDLHVAAARGAAFTLDHDIAFVAEFFELDEELTGLDLSVAPTDLLPHVPGFLV